MHFKCIVYLENIMKRAPRGEQFKFSWVISDKSEQEPIQNPFSAHVGTFTLMASVNPQAMVSVTVKEASQKLLTSFFIFRFWFTFNCTFECFFFQHSNDFNALSGLADNNLL